MTQQLPSPQWATDPYGRHELRYWDGADWTVHVSDHGFQSVDDRTAQPAREHGPSAHDWFPDGTADALLPQARQASNRPAPHLGSTPHQRTPGRSRTPLVVAAVVATGLVSVVAGAAALTSSPDPAPSASGDRVLPLAGRATSTRSRPVTTAAAPSARVSRVASTSADATTATSTARVTTTSRPPTRTSPTVSSTTTPRRSTTTRPKTTSPKPTTTSGPPLKDYKNCADMHTDYPHGVGKKGAHDKTSGTPVTTFFVSNALYQLNSESDRDGDSIACEQH